MPGTTGYVVSECFHTGKATCVSDVYGFGAVLLEVVRGQRPWNKIAGFQFLVDGVWFLHRDGHILEAGDKRGGNDYVAEEAEGLLLLGLACSHPIASDRPKMQTIVQNCQDLLLSLMSRLSSLLSSGLQCGIQAVSVSVLHLEWAILLVQLL